MKGAFLMLQWGRRKSIPQYPAQSAPFRRGALLFPESF
nr:MAG TPA: hypothetical protein [Caudoviricetes sp.]